MRLANVHLHIYIENIKNRKYRIFSNEKIQYISMIYIYRRYISRQPCTCSRLLVTGGYQLSVVTEPLSVTDRVKRVPQVLRVVCRLCTVSAGHQTSRTCECPPPSESLQAAAAAGTGLDGCQPSARQTAYFCTTS